MRRIRVLLGVAAQAERSDEESECYGKYGEGSDCDHHRGIVLNLHLTTVYPMSGEVSKKKSGEVSKKK